MSQPTFTITWKDSSGTHHDITPDILGIPQFTDAGSGEVNSAVLILSAADGQYITSTPYIKDFDKIMIYSTDGHTAFTYIKVYEVKKRIPSQRKDGGAQLEIHMLGLEWHSQAINSGTGGEQFFTTDAFNVAKVLQRVYNKNIGVNDPLMTGLDDATYNKLPNWTTNTYDYGLNEEKCYSRLMQVIDKMGAPVNAGGVFDYFEMASDSLDIDVNSFRMRIFSSGSHDSQVIIKNTVTVNVGETEGGLDTLKGTVVNSWGAVDQGSLPTGWSQFVGGEITYPLFAQWSQSVTYPVDSLVTYGGTLWKVVIPDPGHGHPTNNSFWHNVTRAEWYGNTTQYSPWTKGQSRRWINSGCNMDDVGNASTPPFGAGFFDGNLVINSDDCHRVWADVRATNPLTISDDWKFHIFVKNGFYKGFRVFVKGTGDGDFTGNDINGVPFSNSIVEYRGDDLGWVVKYIPRDNLICAVVESGFCYIFNNPSVKPNEWGNMQLDWIGPNNLDQNATDCFHPYDKNTLTNTYIQNIDPSFTLNLLSAISVTYTWLPAFVLNPLIANWYKFGAWFSLRFPLPCNIKNDSGEIGDLYGGGLDFKGPSTLDTDNMSITPNGLEGFCQGVNSEALGPLSSLDFLIKLTHLGGLTVESLTPLPTANYKMRCSVTDINDNVAIQDFIIPVNDLTASIKLPLTAFNIYQGRKPKSTLIDFVVPPTGVSPVNAFEWRHLKQISIFTAESYDDNGRYDPLGSRWNNISYGLVQAIDLVIDGFRFTKPLLINSRTQGDSNIEPEFTQHEDIMTYTQLFFENQEEVQRIKFPHQEFDLTTTLQYDIKLGDTFWLRDSRLVTTQSPVDVGPDGISINTIKLVAKRIEYSFTKGSDGAPGGALRRIIGVKRFGLT